MKNKKTIKEIVQTYCDDSEKKSLILLDDAEQVKNCMKLLKEIKGQKLIVALSPFAMYELDEQNIPYRIPEEYYDPQELYQMGINNYQKLESICGIIDSTIKKNCSEVAKRDLNPSLYSFYHLKIAYDTVTIRLFQLSKLINTEKPDAIFIYKSKVYPFATSDNESNLLFDNNESIYAQLLTLHGWKVPVVLLSHDLESTVHAPKKNIRDWRGMLLTKVVKWLQDNPKLYAPVYLIYKRKWREAVSYLKNNLQTGETVPVLLYGGGYDWLHCMHDLWSQGISPIYSMSRYEERLLDNQTYLKLDPESLSTTWDKLKGNSEFRGFFILNDIDFFPLLEKKIRFLVEQLTPSCLTVYEESMQLLKNRNIKALLTVPLISCTDHTIAKAARDADIPVIDWQHGSYSYRYHPMVNYIDMMSSDTFFVYGNGVVKQFAEPARRFGTQLIAIGSASLDPLCHNAGSINAKKLLKLNLNPERKVVLYVMMHYFLNHMYISTGPPSDNHLWLVQCAILDVLGRHSNYTPIIKLFPTHKYREPFLRMSARNKRYENCQFFRDEFSFKELLPIADIVIIDNTSTTLLEALTTSKPIFVYTGNIKVEQAEKLLKQRAYSYSDLEEFTSALDTFLSTGSINVKVDLNDRAFLKMYGTHLDDGKSGVRAAKALRSIIQK